MTNNLVQIPEPCSANWNNMQNADGCKRHCTACKTNVHDFSDWSLPDIQKKLAENATEKICGHYHERHTDDSKKVYAVANAIDNTFSKTKLKRFSLIVVSLILLFAGCARRRTMGAWAKVPNTKDKISHTAQTKI